VYRYKMNTVAIITAREGSKRIPKKNIKLFLGKPLITYSIQVVLESGLFERIVVSTDSDEIASVAKEYGAEIPFKRPTELADDYTGTDEVFIHALRWLHENDKIYNYACCIYPTAPMLKAKYLKNGLESLIKNKAASAFSVTTYPYPIFRSLKLNKQGRLEMIWPEYHKTRSQDLPEAFHDAGQFYWVDVEKYFSEKRIYSKDSIPVFIPRYLVQDIDTPEDWEMAEKLYQINQHE